MNIAGFIPRFVFAERKEQTMDTNKYDSPWKMDGNGPGWSDTRLYSASGSHLLDFTRHYLLQDVRPLVLAAPEMLALLEEDIARNDAECDCRPQSGCWRARVKEVIAKAKGTLEKETNNEHE